MNKNLTVVHAALSTTGTDSDMHTDTNSAEDSCFVSDSQALSSIDVAIPVP